MAIVGLRRRQLPPLGRQSYAALSAQSARHGVVSLLPSPNSADGGAASLPRNRRPQAELDHPGSDPLKVSFSKRGYGTGGVGTNLRALVRMVMIGPVATARAIALAAPALAAYR